MSKSAGAIPRELKNSIRFHCESLFEVIDMVKDNWFEIENKSWRTSKLMGNGERFKIILEISSGRKTLLGGESIVQGSSFRI